VQAAAAILVLTRARALALALAHSLDLARDSVLADDPRLARVFGRALDLAHNLESVLGLASSHGLARNLDLARDLASDLASTRDLDLDADRARAVASARDLNRASKRARDLASDLALYLNRARDRARDLTSDLVRSLTRDIAGSSRLNHLSGLALAAALDRAFDVARGLALALTLGLNDSRDLDLDGAGLLLLTLTRARALDHDLALALDRDPAFDHDLTLALYLIEARDNLTEAANSFVGADLTTVRPDAISLAGIRWDSSTQWPTPEWEARVRAASVEDPPGSGVFVVLPEEGHHSADSGSLVPIS
jgi:hypothetical protein